MKWFRLLAGSHTEQDGTTYEEGDIVPSEHDLEAMFVNKFQRVAKPLTGKKKSAPPVEEEGTSTPAPEEGTEDEEVKEEGEPTLVTEFGVDVTDQFAAREGGLMVFRHEENGFTVVDADEPTTPLNDAPLKTNKAVVKFVEKNSKTV